MVQIEHRIDEWGRAIFNGDDAIELLFQGHNITKLCIETTQEIESYNSSCEAHDKLNHMVGVLSLPEDSPETDAAKRQATWRMPVDYYNLDVREKLLSMCQAQEEVERVNLEMIMFEERGLLPVLRLMCFLVDRWREKGVVWGVGRGSSVASYCLFLIGIHKINSLAYGLPINEFLK